MIKRLGTFAAALALTAAAFPTLLAAPAAATSCTTSPCAFSVSATVKTIATISFPSGFTYTWSSVTDNTSSNLAADNNAPTIGGSIRSTTGTGTAQVYFTAPASVAGTGGNNIPISAFSFTCGGSYTENTGAAAGGGALTTTSPAVSVSSSPVVNPGNNYCLNLSSGHSIGSLAITLSLYLDDRYIAADTYTSSGFAVAVSAT